MSQAVKIDSVVKSFGDFHAVDKVSVEIRPGEFFTLLGPSGCGKTTLLRMIAGFHSIDEGEITFNDVSVNHIPAYKRDIGMVFQSYAIFPHMTVKKNVEYGLRARKSKGRELEDRVREVMELMQIRKYADRQPSQLSGGQQQRVALARAIVINPGVLLMDEPLSNLDAKLRVQMRSSIRKIQRQLNITTIYVTHDQEEALAISDRIAVMHDGRIEQLGSPREIYMKPVNTFVADFIGTSGFLPGRADGRGVMVAGKKYLRLPIKPGYQGEVVVSIRPEQAKLAPYREGELTGTVTMATFLGDFMNYEIQIDGQSIIEVNEYLEHEIEAREIGEKVSILPDINRIMVFDGQTRQSVMAG